MPLTPEMRRDLYRRRSMKLKVAADCQSCWKPIELDQDAVEDLHDGNVLKHLECKLREIDANTQALDDRARHNLLVAVEDIVLRLEVRHYGLDGTQAIFSMLEKLQLGEPLSSLTVEEDMYLTMLLAKNGLEQLLQR